MNVEDQLIQRSNDTYEAIRAVNHLINGPSIPAPTAYTVLVNFSCAAFSLDQALHLLGHDLKCSLDDYNVYETDGSDPEKSVIAARLDLDEAADHAGRIGLLLQAAQNAIAGQGHHGHKAAQ